MKNDLELWRKNNTYQLWQAALLIIGQSPDRWAISKIIAGGTPNGFLPVFEKMMEDAKEHKSYRDEVDENVFQTITILDEFVLMIYNIKDRENRTYEEWLSTEVDKGEIRDWIKLRGYATTFFDDYFEIESAIIEKPLSERERNSLYRIIGALLETFEKSVGYEASPFKNQSDLIAQLVKNYAGYEGLSVSKLTGIFPACKKALID